MSEQDGGNVQQSIIDDLREYILKLETRCKELSKKKHDRDELVIVTTMVHNGFSACPDGNVYKSSRECVNIAKELIEQCNLETTRA